MIALIIILVLVLIVILLYKGRVKQIREYKLPENARQLLIEHVSFYNDLSSSNKLVFEERIRDFLANTVVRGVDVEVEDLDRILIASGAIMLIFSFPDWRYNNIVEVLLYKNYFNAGFSTEGAERNIGGMVGDGAMNGKMILSKPALRSSFEDFPNGRNTIIHEFAHLIDKADGSVDGVPEYLLAKPQLLPWINRIREQILDIRMNDGQTDINEYGATNEAEFFAVITEYFFERPEKLKDNYPELYSFLSEMFHPKAVKR